MRLPEKLPPHPNAEPTIRGSCHVCNEPVIPFLLNDQGDMSWSAWCEKQDDEDHDAHTIRCPECGTGAIMAQQGIAERLCCKGIEARLAIEDAENAIEV